MCRTCTQQKLAANQLMVIQYMYNHIELFCAQHELFCAFEIAHYGLGEIPEFHLLGTYSSYAAEKQPYKYDLYLHCFCTLCRLLPLFCAKIV